MLHLAREITLPAKNISPKVRKPQSPSGSGIERRPPEFERGDREGCWVEFAVWKSVGRILFWVPYFFEIEAGCRGPQKVFSRFLTLDSSKGLGGTVSCLYCEQVFEPSPGKIYCSKNCRRKARKARYRKTALKLFTCEQCGSGFKRNADRGHKFRFCSKECVAAAQRKPPEYYNGDADLRLCSQCSGFIEKGRRALCKGCHGSVSYQRQGHLRRAYGMSQEEYDAIRQSQNYLCAICQEQNSVDPRTGEPGL